MRDAICRGILTVGGAGCAPRARGTLGTLAGLAIFLAARTVLSSDPWLVPLAGTLAAGTVLVSLGHWCERRYGAKDPQEVVLDELAGIFLAFAGFSHLTWIDIAIGFLGFRILDILKPFPARQAERLPRNWGILCDDLAAAVYANLFLHAWRIWGPS